MSVLFFGSASDVASADLVILDAERRACVVGLGSTPPAGRPREPEAGNRDPHKKVAPAESPPSKDLSSLGRPARLGIALPVIYRTTLLWLISCRRSCARHVHPSIQLSSAVRSHPEIAASAPEHCNMRYTRRRISLLKDLRCHSGSWGYESLLLFKGESESTARLTLVWLLERPPPLAVLSC